MSVIGKYCKAYPLKRLREFNCWDERARNVKKVKTDNEDATVERALEDDDILFVQENYIVTDGIFMDENVVFDDVTPEWVEFCQTRLMFEVPVDESGN